METLQSARIRQMFMDFFKEKGHQIVPSAPIVIKNDPTLLFTNAGMNQFKDYFLGNKKSPYTRVADTQKCLRVSGKHNDLEEVGVDTYHHTMFEMLGNWSFGNYFKKEAIAWSWQLLTDIYKIDADKIYVTIFEGDANENLPEDKDSLIEWEKYVAPERILRGNKKDNFWEMGDTGPCGPCTEIHVDCRTVEERMAVQGDTLINKDHPQVIEIWNNVFIQYNRLKNGSLEPLPENHVDTGMGFERLVRVLQNKQSNYDTDVFIPSIKETEKIVGLTYEAMDSKKDIAFRVIADHIRAIAFTIADGQLPGNTGAGYVIRRILRRAVRYYYSHLNFREPLLYKLMTVISTQFEMVFPELQSQLTFVQKVVKEEEESFLRTLEKGLVKLDDIIFAAGKQEANIIGGKAAFELYDTFGFPIDLTRLIAQEKGVEVDEPGFLLEMNQQKIRSRKATEIDAGDWIVIDDFPLNEFVGYDSLELRTKVAKYRKVKLKGKELYHIVLEATPFYAESGGQVGDTGELKSGNKTIQVVDTKKENNLIIHITEQNPEELDGEIIAIVNGDRRQAIAVHHSATHLLHAALRKVLGTHVSQKGSLVTDQYLRFDFSHFNKLTDEEILNVERLVNEKIRQNIPVTIKQMPKKNAMEMGAMALFGEKYADMVRVVTMQPDFSIELCGGTHVMQTGELGFFKIINETSIASGVRRMEAVAGTACENYLFEQLELMKEIRFAYKNPKDILNAIGNHLDETAQLKKYAESMEARHLTIIKSQLLEAREVLGEIHFLGAVVEVNNADNLKKLAYLLKGELERSVIVLATAIEGKAHVALLIDDAVVKSHSLLANEIIKSTVSPLIKGGGGGQKNFATAGGQNASNLKEVVSQVRSLIS